MRHLVHKKHFDRSTNHRRHLFVNLVRQLIEQGAIATTQAKAKEIKRIADHLIHRAQDNSLATRRELHRFFGRRDVVNTLVDRVAPAMKSRTSGYTSLQVVGKRKGDNALITKLQLVEPSAMLGGLRKPTASTKEN